MTKHVNDIMRDMFRELPKVKTQDEKRQERIEARNRHMPKICELLEIDFKPLDEDAA